MNKVEDLKERTARACRVLGALGLAQGATGHVSSRIPGNENILVRARGRNELGVQFTQVEQIIEVGPDGMARPGTPDGLEPPLEVFIHTQIYKRRPDVSAVVHVHPLSVVLFTICNKPLLPLYGAYDPPSARLAIDGVPTYPRSILCDTPERGDELADSLAQSKCCLMRGHGITSVGNSVEEAALTAIHLNNLADVNYKAHLLGSPVPIPVDEQEFIYADRDGGSVPQAGDVPKGRPAALWRYYCSLVDKPERS
jgi:ribulose-5-phosphate 4-epimerase/fuculose-1-phosphate aldolase